MSVTGLSSQLNTNVQTALSSNTSPLADKIKQDAEAVETDISNGDPLTLQHDASTLIDDANSAVSSNLLTSSQAGAIQLPAAEAMEGLGVASGAAPGGADPLAQLFQKYAKGNNLPTDTASFEGSWNKFISDISSSVPGFNTAATQSTLQSAHDKAATQAGVSTWTPVGATSSPAGQAASSYLKDVVNGTSATAANFPANFEKDYLKYCQQNNLNPDNYNSYHAFNAEVQKAASSTAGTSSAALVGLKAWDTPGAFSKVRTVIDAQSAPGTTSPAGQAGSNFTTQHPAGSSANNYKPNFTPPPGWQR